MREKARVVVDFKLGLDRLGGESRTLDIGFDAVCCCFAKMRRILTKYVSFLFQLFGCSDSNSVTAGNNLNPPDLLDSFVWLQSHDCVEHKKRRSRVRVQGAFVCL